ncbi:MAG TPA: hypothetical protein VLV15_05490, partial [Dongiaceae bacterium]|nr:hypothetical protein [Dongiaceae bacterium]
MIEQLINASEARTTPQSGIVSVLRHYLALLLAELSSRGESRCPSIGASALPDRVFETLASREFCSLSLGRVTGSRELVVTAVERALRRSEPIHFYYGLGPHGLGAGQATGRPVPCVPDVGLGEL